MSGVNCSDASRRAKPLQAPRPRWGVPPSRFSGYSRGRAVLSNGRRSDRRCACHLLIGRSCRAGWWPEIRCARSPSGWAASPPRSRARWSATAGARPIAPAMPKRLPCGVPAVRSQQNWPSTVACDAPWSAGCSSGGRRSRSPRASSMTILTIRPCASPTKPSIARCLCRPVGPSARS
jgi:hypothetical protein